MSRKDCFSCSPLSACRPCRDRWRNLHQSLRRSSWRRGSQPYRRSIPAAFMSLQSSFACVVTVGGVAIDMSLSSPLPDVASLLITPVHIRCIVIAIGHDDRDLLEFRLSIFVQGRQIAIGCGATGAGQRDANWATTYTRPTRYRFGPRSTPVIQRLDLAQDRPYRSSAAGSCSSGREPVDGKLVPPRAVVPSAQYRYRRRSRARPRVMVAKSGYFALVPLETALRKVRTWQPSFPSR